jgi:hypothetical protein
MMLRLYGPEEVGGVGDVLLNARVLSEKSSQNEEELIMKVTIFLKYSSLVLDV